MGLRQRWNACAVGRAHVLLVEVPGWWATRVAVEQELARRGWPLALSPADADLVVVCGEPGERLTGAVDLVWEQLPGPRARTSITGPEMFDPLNDAGKWLADDDRQRADAAGRAYPSSAGHRDGHGHDGTDHAGMDMAPAGIPLAGGDDDRDGLEMDVLHAPLGPVLPHWPPGLVLHCTLHGDVVTEATVEVLEGRREPPPPAASSVPTRSAVRECDAAARLLALAGWDDAAAAARRVRDLVPAGPVDGTPLAQLARLRSRVARSWSLRWLLRRLGTVDGEALGLLPESRGDVHDRLVAMLDRALADLRGQPVHVAPDPAAVLGALPGLVAGLDLAAVRLVVASLDPDTAAVVRGERTRA